MFNLCFIKNVKQLHCIYRVEIPSVKSNVHSNVVDPLTTLQFSSMFSPQTERFCVDNMSRFKKQFLYLWNKKKILSFFSWDSKKAILYKGKYSPRLIFRPFHHRCQRLSLRLGEFQCLKSSLFQHNCVLGIQDGAKPFISAKGRK